MDNDVSEMVKKFSDMIENSNSNLASNSNSSSEKNAPFDLSKISPEIINQFSNMFQKNTSDADSNKQNFDISTILKMKSVIEKINTKEDPRSNLLKSLKPYLKESRKEKVDQYISLFNMSKVIDVFKETGGGKK